MKSDFFTEAILLPEPRSMSEILNKILEFDLGITALSLHRSMPSFFVVFALLFVPFVLLTIVFLLIVRKLC